MYQVRVEMRETQQGVESLFFDYHTVRESFTDPTWVDALEKLSERFNKFNPPKAIVPPAKKEIPPERWDAKSRFLGNKKE